MSSARQVILGILAAILSAAIVLGSFSLAFIEGGTQVALATKQAPVFTPPPTSTAIPYETSTSPVVVTTSPTASPAPATSTVEPSLTASLPAATETELPSETPTDTAEPETTCIKRTDWPIYIVKPGETLSSIARAIGDPWTYLDIMKGNCMTKDQILPIGPLYVPVLPESGPQPTPMPRSTRAPTETMPAPTLTQTPVPATNTPTSMPAPTDTATQLPPTSSSTPIPKPPTEAPPPRIPTNTPETPAATSETPSAPTPTLTSEGTPDL
ncbi:MAG: LysM peptidoglycan-binding domain-containing protein [Omnitrophica WOR_2 bacterium]